MSSKRTRNRLYWALVNAVSDKDWQNAQPLETAYVGALLGETDTEILSSRAVQDALAAIEERHGPAGLRQVTRPRPRTVRAYVDGIRDTYT